MKRPKEAQRRDKAYDCWLAYRPLEDSMAREYRSICARAVVLGQSPVMDSAIEELERGIRGILDIEPEISRIDIGIRP